MGLERARVRPRVRCCPHLRFYAFTYLRIYALTLLRVYRLASRRDRRIWAQVLASSGGMRSPLILRVRSEQDDLVRVEPFDDPLGHPADQISIRRHSLSRLASTGSHCIARIAQD